VVDPLHLFYPLLFVSNFNGVGDITDAQISKVGLPAHCTDFQIAMGQMDLLKYPNRKNEFLCIYLCLQREILAVMIQILNRLLIY